MDLQDRWGNTPVHDAETAGNLGVVEYLAPLLVEVQKVGEGGEGMASGGAKDEGGV